MKGKKLSEEHKLKISKANNKNGYYRVHKREIGTRPVWCYTYKDDEGYLKMISDENLDHLQEKVIAKGLEWRKFKK